MIKKEYIFFLYLFIIMHLFFVYGLISFQPT